MNAGMRIGFLLALLASFLVEASEAQVNTCKVGTNLVMTGQFAGMGLGIFNSFKLAIDQGNNSGEVKIEVVRGDNAADTAQAVGLATRHGQDPSIVAELCCWISGIGIATHPTYDRAGLPVILAGSNDSRSSRPFHASKVVFRNSPYDLINMRLAATAAVDILKTKRIYLVNDITPFGRSQIAEFEKNLQRLGPDVVIVGRDSLTQGEKDFTALLTKIKAAKPDLIKMAAQVVEYGLFRQQMAKLGMTDISLLGSGGLFSDTYLRLAGPAADGTLATFWGLPIDYYPDGRGIKFDKDYRAAGFNEPYESFGPMAYMAGQVFVQAIKRSGCDRAKVLKDLETQEFDTLIGKFRFDQNGLPDIYTIGLYTVENGKWKLLYISDRQGTKLQKAAR